MFMRGQRMRFASIFGAFLLLWGTLGNVQAGPVAQVQPGEPEIGTVGAIGLDNNGDGWAWAYSEPQTFATNFLLRIEKGSWRIFATSSTNSTLLAPQVSIQRIALSGDGSDGWAIGSSPDDENERPVFWRLDGGNWRTVRHNLPDSTRLVDLSLSADGKSGLIVANDLLESTYRVMRLVNGSWDFMANPVGGSIMRAGISADGMSAWGVGTSGGKQVVYRMAGGNWTAVGSLPLGADDVPQRVATDNAGNGWLLSSTPPDDNSGKIAQRSKLVRLKTDTLPAVVVPAPDAPHSGGESFSMHDLVLNGFGRGTVAAEYFLGSREQPGGFEDLYTPALVSLNGDNAAIIAAQDGGLPLDRNFNPIVLGISPDGGHTWAGGRDGIGFGHLFGLHDPWNHATPAAAVHLSGAALCFAPVANCLRGVFASYWQAHGGLDLFGYPITPEVQEKIGDKTYAVQYTERARFELHPEFAGSPNEVLLGLLGNTLADPRQQEAPFHPAQKVTSFDVQWFAETLHNIATPILPYWQDKGGVPVFGLPRSEAFEEKNAADGKTYLVQYFERNRIEFHPENRGTSFEFQLGLLGVEQFRASYGFTP